MANETPKPPDGRCMDGNHAGLHRFCSRLHDGPNSEMGQEVALVATVIQHQDAELAALRERVRVAEAEADRLRGDLMAAEECNESLSANACALARDAALNEAANVLQAKIDEHDQTSWGPPDRIRHRDYCECFGVTTLEKLRDAIRSLNGAGNVG